MLFHEPHPGRDHKETRKHDGLHNLPPAPDERSKIEHSHGGHRRNLHGCLLLLDFAGRTRLKKHVLLAHVVGQKFHSLFVFIPRYMDQVRKVGLVPQRLRPRKNSEETPCLKSFLPRCPQPSGLSRTPPICGQLLIRLDDRTSLHADALL